MMIYLAGAIDRATENPLNWTDALINAITDRWHRVSESLTFFSPAKAWEGTKMPISQEHGNPIFTINMAAVQECDMLLIKYSPGTETWGTPMEAFAALAAGKFVQAWCDNDPRAGMIDAENWLPTYLVHCLSNNYVAPDVEALAGLVIEYRDSAHNQDGPSDTIVDMIRKAMVMKYGDQV